MCTKQRIHIYNPTPPIYGIVRCTNVILVNFWEIRTLLVMDYFQTVHTFARCTIAQNCAHFGKWPFCTTMHNCTLSLEYLTSDPQFLPTKRMHPLSPSMRIPLSYSSYPPLPWFRPSCHLLMEIHLKKARMFYTHARTMVPGHHRKGSGNSQNKSNVVCERGVQTHKLNLKITGRQRTFETDPNVCSL